MKSNQPKISVITPSYNSSEYIREAIESIQIQDYDNFEHIVVDGQSTDGTLKILRDYDHLSIIAEPDEGIYDAMNKGLEQASGDLIAWLNSDDVYVDNAFSKMVSKFRDNPDSKLIAGSTAIFQANINNNNNTVLAERDFTSASDFKQGNICHNGVLLNGCFLKREFVKSVGKFDNSFKISGDLDYLIRIAALQPNICRVTDVVYKYRQHAGSLTMGKRSMFDNTKETEMMEVIKISKRYMKDESLPSPLRRYCFSKFRDYTMRIFKEYLVNQMYKDAIGILIFSMKQDLSWPVMVWKRVLHKFIS